MENLVSCILATRNRPDFLRQALRCFQRQSYAHAELIVVDDGETSVGQLCAGLPRVHYVQLDKPTPLGRKLNLGVQQSRGSIIQKLDDDDYYHPEFLKRAVSSLPTTGRAHTLVAWDCFLILLAGETRLRFSGHGWRAGATLCFHRALWEKTPFRELAHKVDSWLIKDHQPRIVKVCAPELCIVVRHGHNTWRNMRDGKVVDDCFRRRPVYHKSLDELIEPFDLPFYRSLAKAQGKPIVMNHTSAGLWEYAREVDVTVIIITYNRPDGLRHLLKSLIADADGYAVNCLVYNNGSHLRYEDMPPGNDNFKIKHIDMQRHYEKHEYWQLVNRIFQDIKSLVSRYYLQLPDDVEILPGFCSHAIETYNRIRDPKKIGLSLHLDDQGIGKPKWTKILPTIERHDGISVFKIGWINLCYIAERRLYEALDFRMKPISPARWKSNPRLGSGVGVQMTHRLQDYGFYQVREGYFVSASVSRVMPANRSAGENLSTCQLDPIICGIASVPDRAENLRLTINSILPYVDELHVYLNEYPAVPDYLDHPKISVYRSQDHGDLAAEGKFFTVGKKRGYYFAIDDDIIYPPDFVWNLLNQLRSYRSAGRKVAVGLHGKIMPALVSHYYRGRLHLYHCAHALKEPKAVHILGTGTLAFHTGDLGITIEDFKGFRNMADIQFSIACQKHNVGCVVLPRPRNYIRFQQIPQEKTIWGQYHINDGAQTDLYNSWKDWRIRF